MELTHVNQLSQTKVRLINNYNNDGILLDHDSYPRTRYNTDLFYYNNYWYLLDSWTDIDLALKTTDSTFDSSRRWVLITKITDKDLEQLYSEDNSVNCMYRDFICRDCSDLIFIYELGKANYLKFETIALRKNFAKHLDLDTMETYCIGEDSYSAPYPSILSSMKEIENKYDRKYFKH